VNNVQQLALSYDGNSGASLGNITSKTDAGNYTYNNQKINAVAYVTNPAGSRTPPDVISQDQQDITYTAFQKTATVAENNYLLTYTYGSDYQRIKSVLQQNGGVIETKYYLGDYEKQIKNGITRELHYIHAGNGVCAIIVNEGGAINMYYTYTDYLGSIVAVTNASGTMIAEQNFDAWGRYRNPNDWTYNNVPDQPEWLYRGFTGHEHLKEFALVNMNGRMYDPVLGRMMSPDNYVPTPWNTQGYNRFGYANNNPLVYTDPDGNFFWFIPIIIGTFTAGATYSAIAAINGNWNWSDFGKSIAMGAVGGAIGGAVAQVGISIGASAQSLALNIISNVSSQIGTNLVFGNNITPGLVIGSIIGGLVANSFGNFNGVRGGTLANVGAEIGFNAIKYGVSGGASGGLGAMMDGGDIKTGFINGAKNGAIGGSAMAGLNILSMGPTYIPDRKYGNFGGYQPVYRSGTFLTRAIFGEGAGITLGRNLVTHLAKPGGTLDGIGIDIDDFNQYLRAHETGHYAQEISMGFGKMYQTVLSQYFEYGQLQTYQTPGTLEYEANIYSLNLLGYYYTNDLRRITR
jgi:RHS repeat-associated protein